MNNTSDGYASLRWALKRQKAKLSRLKSQLDSAQSDKFESDKTCKEAESELLALGERLAESETACRESQAELQIARQRGEELSAQLAESENACRKSQAELQIARQKADSLEKRLSELTLGEGVYELITDKIRERIIGEYLRSLKKTVPLIGNGVTPLTPISRPKNLADAKRIAETIIKN